MIAYPVKFAPIVQERIWGGSKLKKWFNVNSDAPIGEYWVLSGHPKGTSVVVNGALAGKTLVQLTEEFPEFYLGDSPQGRFPLLIKFLEAVDDLSVQVHPDDQYAREKEGDFGKTEAWYILEHEPGAKIVYGHYFKNKEEYKLAIKEKRVRDYLRYEEIEKDQLIFIPSRTLHALLAGTILIEIQQTSDVTYRVYDWDRVDSQGRSRELHVEKAADVITYGETEIPKRTSLARYTWVETSRVKYEHLVTCPYFVIEKVWIKGESHTMKPGKKGNPDILVVAEGEGILDSGEGMAPLSLQRGDTVLIPGVVEKYQIYTKSGIKLLRTYY